MSRERNDRGSPSGRLRIVAGKWRSRVLPIADEPGIRPTSDRIRETLFNWLGASVEGSRCLDLFAGTGALGLEALSRGASEVVFVERSTRAVAVLEECLANLQATGAEVLKIDAMIFLQVEPSPFDIVFLDPPFAADLGADLCRLLDDYGWLASGAQVYLEQHREEAVPDLPDGWEILREKTAGHVRYALLRAAK